MLHDLRGRSRSSKVTILAWFLLAGVLACAVHVEGGLTLGNSPAGFDQETCGPQGMVMLAVVVFTTILNELGFLPFPVRSGKSPAYAGSFFHPPESPA